MSNKRDGKQHKLDELVTKFNKVIMGMVTHVTEYYVDVEMSKMRVILEALIEQNPKEPISHFLISVYKNDDYRHNILEQNDKFFLNEEYNEIVEDDRGKLATLFEFKKLWIEIDDETKDFIKKSMVALVKICQKYILTL